MLKRIFITGLTAIIPVAITIYVMGGIFSFADGILGKYINQFLEKYFRYNIPGLGILLFLLIIFLTGVIIHLSRMRVYHLLEGIFLKIPLVKKIYLPIKEIINFILFSPSKAFSSVVLLEYPRKGIYSIGFVTNAQPKGFTEKLQKKIYTVFIPTSPSPLTGMTIIVPEDELIFLEISVEEAIKLVVSGGLLTPDEKSS